MNLYKYYHHPETLPYYTQRIIIPGAWFDTIADNRITGEQLKAGIQHLDQINQITHLLYNHSLDVRQYDNHSEIFKVIGRRLLFLSMQSHNLGALYSSYMRWSTIIYVDIKDEFWECVVNMVLKDTKESSDRVGVSDAHMALSAAIFARKRLPELESAFLDAKNKIPYRDLYSYYDIVTNRSWPEFQEMFANNNPELIKKYGGR